MAEQELQNAVTAIQVEFAKAIKSHHTSLRAIARAIGVSESQLNQAMAGRSQPKDIEIRNKARELLGMKEESK